MPALRRPVLLIAALMIAALPLAVALWHNPWRGFFITPDADIIYVGEALRFAQGLPQNYNDHPGYLHILLLSIWLKLGAFLGWLPPAGVTAAATAPDIDAYMQSMVQAGRWYSTAFACAFTGLFMTGLRLAGLRWNMVLAAGLAIAVSPAVTIHAVIIRAELQSALGPVLAFLILAWAARHNGWRRWGLTAAAGMFAVAGLENKVQAIFPLLALPPLAMLLPFGGKAAPSWGTQGLETPAGLAAMAASLPALVMVGLTMWVTPFVPAPAGYQAMIILWVLGWMAAWCRVNGQSRREYVRGVLALTLGIALGLYLLLIHHSLRNTDTLVHFIEHMRVFSSSASPVRDGLLGQMVGRLILFHGLWQNAASTLLTLGVLSGAVLLMRRRLWRPALLSAGLALAALVIELSFTLRGLHLYYQIYIWPFQVIAAAIGADALGLRRMIAPAAIALAALGLGQSLAPTLVHHQKKSNVCYQAQTYLPPDLAERLNGYCGLED